MDLDAVRTFVAAADAGQFSEAADSLSIPVYPHSLIWRGDNPHPALAVLRSHLGSARPGQRHAGTWTPSWAQPSAPPGPRAFPDRLR